MDWTEAATLEFFKDEHSNRERKGAGTLDENNAGKVKADLAKAVGAMANFGGGQILFGVENDGTVSGVRDQQGSTPRREWLEQIIPTLHQPPLSAFRVHEVARDTDSRIPAGKVLLVVEVDDSPLAPHQTVGTREYFYREGSHSRPAPHFHLELLRNRMTHADLRLYPVDVGSGGTIERSGQINYDFRINFAVRNVGRITARLWAIVVERWEWDSTISEIYWPEPSMSPKACPATFAFERPILGSLETPFDIPFGVVLPTEFEDEFEARRRVAAFYEPLAVHVRLVGDGTQGHELRVVPHDLCSTDELMKKLEYRVRHHYPKTLTT